MAINYDKNKERPIVDSVKTGEFLAALRKAAGYTQQEVADYLSITNKTISKWESGAGLPEISILPAVAELYGVTVDELLAGKRLERFVEKETAESHFGGKAEKPEKAEARRRWLEESLQERFHQAQVILWGTSLAGYVILLGVYMGFRRMGIASAWFSILWGCIWLLAEGVVCYLFWHRYVRSVKAWAEEQQREIAIFLHEKRMKLVLPFIMALAAILPLVWIEPFVIPFNIPALVGSGEPITKTIQLYAALLGKNAKFGSGTQVEISVGSMFITMERLLKALPITVLAGCLLWKLLSYGDLLRIRYQQGEIKRRLRRLLVALVFAVTSLFLIGEGLQALQVVSYVKYTDAFVFEMWTEGYLLVYNNSLQMGQHEGPELEYGVERIDHLHLDQAIRGKERYEKYQGLFAIDYDECKTYQISTWADRLQAKDTSIMVVSALSLIGIIVFYVRYRKERWPEMLWEERKQQVEGV